MDFFERLFRLGKGKTKTTKKARKRVSAEITRSIDYAVDIDMESFDNSVSMAEDTQLPNRFLLYKFYKKTSKDSHILSQVRTARFTVQQAPFYVALDNKENEELTKLFDVQWFLDFLKHALDAEFWSHSLIEFSDITEKGVFKWVKLIPREHVKPNSKEVLLSVYDTEGISYEGQEDAWFLLEVNGAEELGLYETATREYIWKYYSRSDWSKATERFGMPLIVIRSEAEEKELDKLEEFAANFGTSGYAILDKNDEVEIVAPAGGSTFHEMYKTKADFCDAQLSKLVNGQTGSSEEKAYVGSAEVHERILNTYTLARMKRIQNLVNDKLIPFMIEKGYKLNNCKFQFTELLPKEKKTNLDKEDNKKKSLTYTY